MLNAKWYSRVNKYKPISVRFVLSEDQVKPPSDVGVRTSENDVERYFDDLTRELLLATEQDQDVGHRTYEALKRTSYFMFDAMGPLLRDALQGWMRTPAAASILQGPTTIAWMQMLSRMSESAAKIYGKRGHGLLYSPPFNHKMLAENAKGQVGTIAPKQLYDLFPQTTEDSFLPEKNWPRLVLTSHHARAGGMRDVTSITHGIEAMMRQCFDQEDGRKHPPLYDFETGDLWHPHVQRRPNHPQLMVAYACDVEKDPLANGAALLARIAELERMAAVSKSYGTKKAESQDQHSHTSQSAFRLAKIVLQCLVTEPERIDPEHRGSLATQSSLGEKPLLLRQDAAMVAQHIALIGYSKGGNVVSDAMRILVDELLQKNAKGESLFHIPVKPRYEGFDIMHTMYEPIHQPNNPNAALQNIHGIICNIPVLSLAAIEVPLAEKYTQAGVRRVSINNENDLISGHTQLQKSQGNDEVIRVKGVRDLLGHAPEDALGSKKSKGYFLENEAARRRIEEFFCALYGAAAIGSLHFKYDDKFATENRIVIEPAAGTSNKAIIGSCKIIEDHLKREGFTGVHVGISEYNLSELKIRVNEPLFVNVTLEKDHDASELEAHIAQVESNVHKLANAFKAMRDEEPSLVINASVDADIQAHFERLQGQQGAWQKHVSQQSEGRDLSGLFDGTYNHAAQR